ncbi:MAG: hypothetical protein QX197_06645 [Methylococcaceae bacterium]
MSDTNLADCFDGNGVVVKLLQLFNTVMAAGAEDNLSAIIISVNPEKS